ncbi:SseB family protein [Arthrobacter roseus]|uniref:SseB family protein n=1 Tax=Arthrobacter roseus TaxID=136274 RepID=UPI00196433DB|nr:SseB family protein [Arthrobacter roseus]MBM7849718.1 hypothetical protein [Arthrobacter roseus]
MTEETGNTPSPNESMKPENPIDLAIVAGHEGRMTNQEVLEVIWNSELISVGRMEDEADASTFQALSLTAPDSEEKIVVTFSDPKHIPTQLREVAPFAISNAGQATIRSIQPGYGMAINPGITPGIELGAESVAKINAAFAAQAENPDNDETAPDQDETR